MIENERVGGPRTYTGPEAKVAAIWRCPACSEQNEGPLVDGCVHCGSGRPGVHKGVDPVVTPEERARILAAQNKSVNIVKTRAVGPSTLNLGEADLAFAMWADLMEIQPSEMTVARKAFVAGWKMRATKLHDSVTMELPEPKLPDADPIEENRPGDPVEETEPPQFPPTQIRQRTLLAALRSFRETVLPEAGEEVATGEWLAVADVDAWIVELEKELA